MFKILAVCLALAASLGACASAASSPAISTGAQHDADLYAIDQMEVTWHKAASMKDVDLMMSLWADDATFTVGTKTYAGKAQIRDFFANTAAPFKPQNIWVSETPAYKMRTTANGDRGTLYFECHYVDADPNSPTFKQLMSAVAADQNVARQNGTWVITNSIAASPELTP